MSADERPELRAVRAEDLRVVEGPGSSASPGVEAERKLPRAWGRARERIGSALAGRKWLSLFLALALAAACLGYVYQQQRAQELEARLTALQGELQEARQDLRAHQEHMQQVRGQVDDLAERLGRLRETVATDPVAR